MSTFSADDLLVLEGMVSENFEDAVMVNSLAKLQQAHITMTEKLNNIFAQSVLKHPHQKYHQQLQQTQNDSLPSQQVQKQSS